MSPATITLIFLAFAILLFVTEKIPLGLTSMVVCIGLVVTGVLSVGDAFSGFINSNVILFVAMFIVGGALFGSAGIKLLSSKDAKKAYTHATAAALRVKESVMGTVTSVQENAADILAAAKDINEQRAAQEEIVEDTSTEATEA